MSVEGYPTLILWPAERSNSTQNKASPIRYQGAREVEEMEAFIRKHSVSLQLVKAMEDKVAALEVCKYVGVHLLVCACLRCRQPCASSDKAADSGSE